jgi:hypothetical protein
MVMKARIPYNMANIWAVNLILTCDTGRSHSALDEDLPVHMV